MRRVKQGVRRLTRLFRTRRNLPECAENLPVKVTFCRPGIEQLEDRTLLSAGPAPLDALFAPRTGVLGDTTQVAVVNAVPLSSFAAFAQGQPVPAQVVIVDPAVTDYAA